MTQNNESPVVPTETKKKVSLSIPRTVLTHVASFFAGAAAYAGVQKLSETDVEVKVDDRTVIGD